MKLPFWPAESFFDVPLIVQEWAMIATEAEAMAQEQLARKHGK
jgi:hypothetical protein